MRHTLLVSWTRRATLITAATAAAMLGFANLAHAAKTELLVYSALEADQIKAYKTGFETAHPDIELKFVRDSTGIITARLLAEKANPQADVIWGVAATSLMLLGVLWMLFARKLTPLERVAWTLVLGGGIGNLIDRIATGVVVDYINVLFMNFAIFNFADICVCVGVGLLMVWVLFDSDFKEKAEKSVKTESAAPADDANGKN